MSGWAEKGEKMEYDTSVIRPEMRAESVKWRGEGLSRQRAREIQKRLRVLHTLEIMAVNIYKCQIASKHCNVDGVLTMAMCNEMTHAQDFQTKLYEYGLRPSKVRWAYWLVGYGFGMGSRLLGRKRVLRTGLWTEEKAVHHYGLLLKEIEWDADMRAVIEKNMADEYGHIEHWKHFLEHPEEIC
jgi:demethoxyubiquinone hydroxylase (CLK1/Coq7/Cat5 family)